MEDADPQFPVQRRAPPQFTFALLQTSSRPRLCTTPDSSLDPPIRVRKCKSALLSVPTDGFTAHSSWRVPVPPEIIAYCKQSGAGDIVPLPATACPPRQKARSNFPAVEPQRWSRITSDGSSSWIKTEGFRSPPVSNRQSQINRFPALEHPSGLPGAKPTDPEINSELEELHRRLQSQMRRPKPGPDAMAAALEAVQRLAAEADIEDAAADAADGVGNPSAGVCRVCGHRNRQGYKFCGMCGLPVETAGRQSAGASPSDEDFPSGFAPLPPAPWAGRDAEPEPSARRGGGGDSPLPPSLSPSLLPRREGRCEPSRHIRHRPRVREAASACGPARRIHEPRRGCGAPHHSGVGSGLQHQAPGRSARALRPDALVLRSNFPPVRGAAAVREFFFWALDAGLGEVEMDPSRVEVVGDMAYEAGRCKALVPARPASGARSAANICGCWRGRATGSGS